MPLVRFEVRSEYGLGQPELYSEVDREDPREVLDGVAVARLVGILRQLGDLAEFAAEIFHGIQEEVMTTASRSHELMIRVQRIDAAAPSVERAVWAQTCHMHFAYTAGREWHPRIPNEQNHFINSDLPRFIMDSYEDCRDPPRFHLLDKFDIGGPGSCLKRYSDPNYFRRASGTSMEANNESLKYKKKRKIKTKRSSQRNRNISCLASISSQSSRGQFTSLSISERTSSSQTASAADMIKSDLQDHSNSCDSRSGSGYSLGSVVKPKENESKESSFRLTQHADTVGSVLSDVQSEFVDENCLYCPSQHKQAARGSSCVSWDDKAEIVECDGQQCVKDDVPDRIEGKFSNLSAFDRLDFPSNEIHNTKPIPNRPNEIDRGLEIDDDAEIESEPRIENEPDIEREPGIESKPEIASELGNESEEETESEEDDYVDAPDTIKSESENDSKHQTKHEMQKYASNVKNSRPEDLVNEHDYGKLYQTQDEQHSTNVKDQRLEDAAYDRMACNPDYNQSCKLPDLVSLENISDEQMPQVSGVSSDLNHLPGTEIYANGNVHKASKEESVVRFSSLSTPVADISDSLNPLCINGVHEPQESQVETQPVKIWTNGRLLGLEPSKPPVFAVPNTASQDSKTKDWLDAPSNAQLQSACEKASQPFANGQGLTKTSMVTQRTEVSIGLDIKDDGYSGAHQENGETLSGVFGLSHRFLKNGFCIKEPFTNNPKSSPASIPETTEVTERFELYGQAVQETTFKRPFDHEIPLDWLASSPPIEHMKISFNPADRMQSSKLKLKFPSGVQSHESNKITFPSFQLVPEPAVSFTGTDSDDDTFCRSSPYMSDDDDVDDYLSDNHSESNSEHLEGESSEGKDQEIYNALHGSMHVEDGEEASLSNSLLDVPSFDALEPRLLRETLDISDVSKIHLNQQNRVEPTPPPLPPVQWRVSETPSDRFEGEQQTLQDALGHAFSEKISVSSGSNPLNVDQLNKNRSNFVAASSIPEIEVNQMFNGVEDSTQNVNGKETDKGDFLQQIRAKHFSLRRTVTTRPSTTNGPVSNANIHAILEKADAIRQAIASDDDGDETDTWSDT